MQRASQRLNRCHVVLCWRLETARCNALRRQVWPLLESGAVQPVVHATFPLREAAEAHRVMEANEAHGKMVVVHD